MYNLVDCVSLRLMNRSSHRYKLKENIILLPATPRKLTSNRRKMVVFVTSAEVCARCSRTTEPILAGARCFAKTPKEKRNEQTFTSAMWRQSNFSSALVEFKSRGI